MKTHLKLVQLDTRRRLFGLHEQDIAPVSDAQMWRILGELRAAPVLQPFRLWLVGSRVESGKASSDVDLVLSPRVGYALSDALIERALWYCRYFGLYAAKPACVLDPCFRAGGPTLAIGPLQPDTVIKTIKLFSPKLAKLIRDGQISEYRRIGRCGIEYIRRASDTEYYRKLPSRAFDGVPLPYLRPAIDPGN